VRGNTAWALGEIGPKAAPAVPALSQALNDEEERVREKAAQALQRIASDQ
jgi:HEAT repeat protein